MRFAFLDGIRGIAALFVVARHWNALLGFDVPYGHLAVDIFFMLSGFVIAHAYDEKLRSGSMSAGGFMSIRLARLYPMYLLASIFAFAVVLTLASAGRIPQYQGGEWLTSALMLLFFLPSPVAGAAFLFPVNGSVWSLFFELAVNIAYAYGRRLLSDRFLIGLTAVSGLMLIAIAIKTGTIDHGYRSTIASVAAGVIRATFGIAAGLLMYRRRSALRRFAGTWSPWFGVALIAAVLGFPAVVDHPAIVELSAIFVVFPAAIALAAAREPSQGWQLRSMIMLGIASYPIYLLHVPLGKLLAFAVEPIPELARPIGLCTMCALVFLSLLIERHLDIPARTWLRARLLSRRAAM